MPKNLFPTYAPILRDMSESALLGEIENPEKLLIASGKYRGVRIDVAYSVFDYVNQNADVVIVGLTPGRQQMRNALLEAQRCLKAGRPEQDAMKAAKTYASFSGPMRKNLVAMLDSVGASTALGLRSTASFWDIDSQRVHFTSALRYPVFIDGKNYSGSPSIVSVPFLRAQLMQWFSTEMADLSRAIFIPLGPKVTEALEAVAEELSLPTERVLSGLPHPSGANAERIAFFLGRKRREDVSSKVDPVRLLAARATLEGKIAMWA